MENRANALRAMRICRFCLCDSGPMRNIYERETRNQQNIPLTLQIMACVAIEVFPNDGMPQLICNECRLQTVQAYKFKTTCKKSDDALKLYLATGNLFKPEKNAKDTKESETVESTKKRASESVPSAQSKKQKTTVVIEGNIQEEFSIQNVEELTYVLDEHGEEVAQAVEHITILNEDGETTYYAEQKSDGGDENEEEDITHPTLKVSQIKTDVFPCDRCERSFPLKQLLDIHMKNHTRERKFGCDECGRKFFSKYDLGKHYLVHTGDKPFTCSVCSKAFSRESLLHRHEKIHVEVPKYLCTYCDRTFLTSENLDAHSEKHNKCRPFQCRLCKKSFVFKQGLDRHEITHTEAAAHKCNYCEASFTTPGKLARHITSHAGIRPYPCKVCSRTFLLSHHLTRHMRTSHGSNAVPEKVEPSNSQFKCDVCSMSFRRKDSLINHTAIHSMVNLKCIICNTSFPNAKLVKDHITTHLTGLPYPCDKCEYSFDTQTQLEEHEVKHIEYEGSDEDADKGNESESVYDEYIIPDNRPPVDTIRKSRREQKIKNYAQFLKDELGSDSESQHDDSDDTTDTDVVMPPKHAPVLTDSIKPVVRTEGTKVYQRKGKANDSAKPKTRQTILNQMPSASTAIDESEITQTVTTLDNLGLNQQTVNDLPDSTFIEMKIGQKIVKVKKLMKTKAQIEAMLKEGKIKVEGNTMLLKNDQLNALQKKVNSPKVATSSHTVVKATPAKITKTVKEVQTPKQSVKKVEVENVEGERLILPQNPIVKKTYVKRNQTNAEIGKQSNNDKKVDDKDNPKEDVDASSAVIIDAEKTPDVHVKDSNVSAENCAVTDAS